MPHRFSGCQLFKFPIRVFGMLQVPERAAAAHFRKLFEVVFRWRRGGSPLERPCIPGVVPGDLSFPGQPDHVYDKDNGADSLIERSNPPPASSFALHEIFLQRSGVVVGFVLCGVN